MKTNENIFRKMIYIILFLGIGIIPLELRGYDLSGMRLREDEKKKSISLDDSDKKFSGQIKVVRAADFPKLKVSAAPDALVIDTREVEKPVHFYFIRVKQNLIVRASADGQPVSEKNRLSIELQSDAPSEIEVLFEGETEKDGKRKHFWKSKMFPLSGKTQTLVFNQVFPANLKRLVHFRITMKKPIRLEIRKIDFEKVPVEKKKINPSVNHILNGGAERGLTGIHSLFRKLITNAAPKKEVRLFLDRQTKYEGEYSFCLEKTAGAWGVKNLIFNPVPYIPGAAASMTFYAKAEKPLSLEVELFLANGVALVSTFRIGTEWKKYEFYIPSWGMKGKGFSFCGDPVNSYAHPTGVVQPTITIHEPGKVWIDNVAYSIGGHAVYKEKDSFFVTHKLNKDSCYYFSDEIIEAELSFRNASEKDFKGKAAYEILDVFGKSVFSKEIGNIAVPAGQTIKERVAIRVPPELRGPFNAVFSVTSGKRVYSDVAYAGIIDRGGDLNKRIGLQVNAFQNFNLASEYLRHFRVGSIRIGTAAGGCSFASLKSAAEGTKILKSCNFDIMFNTGLSRPTHKDPALWKVEMENHEKILEEYGEYIDIIESDNEANITGGTNKQNLQSIRELSDIMKKYNLKCKLAGPTTCTLDFSWTTAILSSEEGKLLDIVTNHPYRDLPELPDYTDEAMAMRKNIDLYRPGIPQYATEAGRVQPYMPENHGFIGEYSRTTAARDIRNIILGFAGGVDRYYHFSLSVWPMGSQWNVLYAGTLGNNGLPRPNPTLYALRTLSDRLEQAKFVTRIKLGADYRCPVFDHGEKRTAVIWKWNGNPGTLTFKPEDAKQFTAYDFVGTKLPSDKLKMNEFPIYLDTSLSAEGAEKAIRRGTLTAEGTSPFEVASAIIGENRFAVEVRNRTGNTLKDVTVSVDTPNAVSGSAIKMIDMIGPEAKARTEFELNKPISTNDFNVKISVLDPKSKIRKTGKENLRAILVKKTMKPLVIDGDLSDWPKNAAVVKLDNSNAVRRPGKWGVNEDKIHAELRYAWDDDFLYTAVTVFKPEFHPLKDMKNITYAWKQDSVQICYDTLRNAKPETVNVMDDDFEYTLVQCGNAPVVYRRWGSSALHDSLNKAIGVIMDEVKFAVKRYDDRVVYEMAFPKQSVSPFKLYPYSMMRTGLIVNVNNGKERAGWLELTPGVGQSPKRPGQWMDLVLLP